jgi:hypothetical protein
MVTVVSTAWADALEARCLSGLVLFTMTKKLPADF